MNVKQYFALPLIYRQIIKNPNLELIAPALHGKQNILNTVNLFKSVKQVILTSSVVTVYGDNIELYLSNIDVFNESDYNTLSSIQNQPYSYSKP